MSSLHSHVTCPFMSRHPSTCMSHLSTHVMSHLFTHVTLSFHWHFTSVHSHFTSALHSRHIIHLFKCHIVFLLRSSLTPITRQDLPLPLPPSPSPLGTIVLRYFGRPYISASPAYKQYLCLFCKDIPHQPCTLKCCGKVSCRDCGKGPGTCPGCGGRVITVTDTPLERRIKEVRVFCPNAGRGCYQLRSMSLMDVMQHR